MTDIKKKRVQRSVSVETNTFERIVSMSERLGVTVNAYLVDAIGQKLYRDESLLRIEKATADATTDSLNKMVDMISQMADKENPSQ